ncbi:SDR family NAD(P)-dependent oxidoreductase [Nocardia sp. NPDC056100]|uniref:SDR family NAD(P)-dependent oxidoreductase n=1 Tax=Nocardia sp. NPDC056100 TaxID=3345712 RepID=UPI0035DE97AC
MTLISTPFGFDSSTTDATAGLDLTGRRAMVTGASSGLGAETARALAAIGAEVTLAVRDPEAGKRVAAEITESTGNTSVHVGVVDLTDPESVTGFAAGWDGPLDILVNNAGVMARPERHTDQGWEWQFATNHLGHFTLATALHRGLAAAEAARIVTVSSSGHQLSPIVWDDIHFAFRPYDPWLAYGQSKTANVLFAVEATRRWASDGITANAVTPGAVYTNLQRHTGGRGSGRVPAEQIRTVDKAAATAVLVATSPELHGIGGHYFADCNETDTVERRTGTLYGVARYALDPTGAQRLWERSERMIAEATR